MIDQIIARWREEKARHPASVVFIRAGDWYETFAEDAWLIKRAFERPVTMLRTSDGTPEAHAGIPFHDFARSVQYLTAAGHTRIIDASV